MIFDPRNAGSKIKIVDIELIYKLRPFEWESFFVINSRGSMNKKNLFFIVILGILTAPLVGFAQLEPYGVGGGPQVTNWHNIFNAATLAAGALFGCIAVIMFVAAGILFLTAQGAPEKLKEARAAVLWGVVGVVVGIIAFTIIRIVGNLVS